MSTVSWADLHDNVPTHRDRDDFELWNKSLRQYCFAKGVLPHLDWVMEEPFRRVKIPIWGKWAAGCEPRGDEIEEKLFTMLRFKQAQALGISIHQFISDRHIVTLSREELVLWDRWADKERLAHMAVLRSLSPELQRDEHLLAQPTAHHLYMMIVNRYPDVVRGA